MSDGYVGYDSSTATRDLRNALLSEIIQLSQLVAETAKGNVRYYPEVREHIRQHLETLASDMFSMHITADYWQAWLEQFGKGSLMADSSQNAGLVRYMSSDSWNALRPSGSHVVVGRGKGRYKSIDGSIKQSGGSYAGVDLEELAARGDIDKSFGPTPPTFFLRIALQANRKRILEGLQRVIDNFPYHKYFKMR
ncbi:hypothetical protein DFQ01_103233 [Paenibacillus cellulosilyticus]|uniref:Uncharacterized protein n=1 Tax=Paenibacillus cellulosilyticus TaxID=375489 RepID=A0A2V2YYH5_9BACL|nr:hypothetical protein [Paenibacillus cellulosilyticus]PWW06331.1 hypothetical protein DFQ01_103233 [Paenibacillus cellulosilyticus]QKS42926.1 hypothetical protein HUB94_00025 [Paenibacillus cellulosilyticus]QKS43453.1 hypothetical protein HUB94_02705 [Paenibacillus cellulosilyticus]QKS46317.1 hypothetical protein HUB94_19070 [Paenibacillus cellulosilyticus]